MIEATALTEFLESSLKILLDRDDPPDQVAIAYIHNGAVYLGYTKCGYDDLQRIGQEFINEGTIKLIAINKDRIEQIQAEAESEDPDEA